MIKEFESEILETINLTSDVKSIKIRQPKDFNFKAGQYISISFPIENSKLRKPYSIASSPDEKEFLELCIKRIDKGPVSNFVCNLKQGDKIEFLGPVGEFTIKEESKNKDLIFISAGTGIGPFKSMIQHLLENNFKNKIVLIKGFRHETGILSDKEFKELQEKHSNFEFYNILSQPKDQNFENIGHVQDFLDKFIPENFEGHVYLCGLSIMIDQTGEKLIERGIKVEQIFFEKYD